MGGLGPFIPARALCHLVYILRSIFALFVAYIFRKGDVTTFTSVVIPLLHIFLQEIHTHTRLNPQKTTFSFRFIDEIHKGKTNQTYFLVFSFFHWPSFLERKASLFFTAS